MQIIDLTWKQDKTGIIVVKDGRKIEAKISHTGTEWLIVRAGMAFYRPTVTDALEFVRSNREERASAFGAEVTVRYPHCNY